MPGAATFCDKSLYQYAYITQIISLVLYVLFYCVMFCAFDVYINDDGQMQTDYKLNKMQFSGYGSLDKKVEKYQTEQGLATAVSDPWPGQVKTEIWDIKHSKRGSHLLVLTSDPLISNPLIFVLM